MKNLILAVGLFLGGNSAMAAEVQIFKNAVITTCPAGKWGCASDLITSTNDSYLVDQHYAQVFLTKHGHLTEKAEGPVSVREVMGVVVKETGHMPNFAAEFSVIKIIAIIE